MTKENYRKNLIKLLKTSKIYYINMFDEIEDCKLKEVVEEEIDKINQDIETLRFLYIMANAFGADGIPHIDYNDLVVEKNKQIKSVLNEINIIDIRDSYSLETIAEELSKIGEHEDFYYYYKYSKLKELKDVRKQGTQATLKYIQTNGKK